jgi:hypothetical protein
MVSQPMTAEMKIQQKTHGLSSNRHMAPALCQFEGAWSPVQIRPPHPKIPQSNQGFWRFPNKNSSDCATSAEQRAGLANRPESAELQLIAPLGTFRPGVSAKHRLQ